jgi:hypothetical protein
MTSTTASDFYEADYSGANTASMVQIYKKFALFPNKRRKNYLLNPLNTPSALWKNLLFQRAHTKI